MRSPVRYALLFVPLLLITPHAQRKGDPIEHIREADLKADLFALAGDETRGREGGTIDELAASAWLAERARAAGLEAAGDNGTYFQFFPLERFRVSAGSSVTLAGTPLRMGADVVTDAIVLAHVDAPTVTIGQDALSGQGGALAGLELKDRVAVVSYVPPAPSADAPAAPAAGPRARNALRSWARGVQKQLAGESPAAIVVLVPDAAKDQWERVAFPFTRGAYAIDPDGTLESIVAVLNGDMIGRNDPNTAALLGALPPHRNSPEFVAMAEAANDAVSQFTIDSSWDDPKHREGWYYRSDHLPYARAGIPALFFTTLLHPDYHTPFDNPDRIDITKLGKMTRWMYATGRLAADADKAPAVDPAFKLERCRDFTGTYC